ncbi:DUF434 domain-containing protein [Thermophagus sp. OGC60D27]|uniref:DUF434 domain-containing protein n=1 Tax=Thermophagus sp. OGC60D27 TaxID=3458415 RepID=UPI0040377B75
MSPDNRKHRGPGPRDHLLFTEELIKIMSQAAKDYCWLLDRNYTAKAALKLVGDHYKLRERQRTALDRVCQPQELVARVAAGELYMPEELKNQPIIIDGFNLLIILEAVLSGAPVFKGRDGLIRDISGIHGSYRKISETPKAIELTATFFKQYHAGTVLWVFDKPVSNSGRLAQLVKEIGRNNNISWETKLADQTDNKVAEANQIVISSDSQILARSKQWFNLISFLLNNKTIKSIWLIDIWKY